MKRTYRIANNILFAKGNERDKRHEMKGTKDTKGYIRYVKDIYSIHKQFIDTMKRTKVKLQEISIYGSEIYQKQQENRRFYPQMVAQQMLSGDVLKVLIPCWGGVERNKKQKMDNLGFLINECKPDRPLGKIQISQ